MSKFISSSVNYSETNLLKTKFLSNILQTYNEHILSNKLNNTITDTSYIIPNNNVKYYLFIINKKDLVDNTTTSRNSQNYKICYFFPTTTTTTTTTTILDTNTFTDFYVEIDNNPCFINNSYLFEGYLYPAVNGNLKTFLITDILTIDSEIISCKYSLRYSLINKIITTASQDLSNLNGHLNINIHSMFDISTDVTSNRTTELFNLFKNNFIFKDYINSIEYINEYSLTKTQQIIINNKVKQCNPQIKKISKTKYIDVYDVANIDTNNNEGILYVKSLYDSKILYDKLSQESFIIIECVFNNSFKKWQLNTSFK